MPKNNIYLIKENYKKTEEVREIDYKVPSYREFLKTYENDGGLNYADLNGGGVGEVKGYGPCEYYDCPYSNNCRFYLRIGFSGRDIKFYGRDETGDYGCNVYWITMENIEKARNVLRKLEKGNVNTNNSECYYVVECTSLFGDSEWSSGTRNAREKHAEIMRRLKNYIDYHEMGGEVYEPRVDFKDDGGCSGVVM